MKMTLKMDGTQVVLHDGKPVYELDDGKEFVADVPSLYGKTLELKGEAKRNREMREQAEAQLKSYRELFPAEDSDALKEWKQQAETALETMQNLSDKKLMDAGRVDEIKKELRDAHDKNLSQIKKQFADKETEFQGITSKKDAQIFDLLVGNAFASSKYFSGPKPLTLLPPDAALALFRKNFQVQENTHTGELQVVGYWNGTEILSKKPDQVGEIATIDEAIEYLIDKYPHKDRIMGAGTSGSGAGGGAGFSTGGGDEITRLQKQLVAAQDAGDARAVITIQNRMYTLQRQQVPPITP